MYVALSKIYSCLHPSDLVVFLSQDASLKRCFGIDEYILHCDWEYLSTLRTLRDPNARMPRLIDLLEYIASPGLEDVWIILDIKVGPPRFRCAVVAFFLSD
jgi:hypothetical protein